MGFGNFVGFRNRSKYASSLANPIAIISSFTSVTSLQAQPAAPCQSLMHVPDLWITSIGWVWGVCVVHRPVAVLVIPPSAK